MGLRGSQQMAARAIPAPRSEAVHSSIPFAFLTYLQSRGFGIGQPVPLDAPPTSLLEVPAPSCGAGMQAAG